MTRLALYDGGTLTAKYMGDSTCGASEKAALAASFADGAGVALEDVSISVVDLPEGGGVEIVATVAVLSEAAAATASAATAAAAGRTWRGRSGR